MKSQFAIALLIAAVLPCAVSCTAYPESEPTQEAAEAQINNGGGGSPDHTKQELLDLGYECGTLDGETYCTKEGAPDYVCDGSDNCTSLAVKSYRFRTLAHLGSCMDAAGGGTANGTKIQAYSCNDTPAQSFWIEDLGGGFSRLINMHSGTCVDAQGNGITNGTSIQLYTCNGTSAQAWQIVNMGGGNVRFVGQHSGKCIDVAGANPANGTKIQLYTCNGTNAQSWYQEQTL